MTVISPTLTLLEVFRSLGCRVRGRGDEIAITDGRGIELRVRPPRGDWIRVESNPLEVVTAPGGSDAERATEARLAPPGPLALRPARRSPGALILTADRPLLAPSPLPLETESWLPGAEEADPQLGPTLTDDERWARTVLAGARRLARRRPRRDPHLAPRRSPDLERCATALGAAGWAVTAQEGSLRIGITRPGSYRVARLVPTADGPRVVLPLAKSGAWSEVSRRAATEIAAHAAARLRLVRIIADRSDPEEPWTAEVHFGALRLEAGWLERGLAALSAADAWFGDEFPTLADPAVATAVLTALDRRPELTPGGTVPAGNDRPDRPAGTRAG